MNFNYLTTEKDGPAYRTTTVLNLNGIVNNLCLSRGQKRCSKGPV